MAKLSDELTAIEYKRLEFSFFRDIVPEPIQVSEGVCIDRLVLFKFLNQLKWKKLSVFKKMIKRFCKYTASKIVKNSINTMSNKDNALLIKS